ncbi:DUF5655 domain-containing protein [Glutamicibacter sp.]|uniref:DUF5655 domain-containing protein n=1 Tax=Glutamicibacter sp. TaxID=1931995 RepID=UPI003D6A5169
MSDLKIFRIDGGMATELPGTDMALEKSLQTMIERNMETLFGVRFLASEYSTGINHGGRMDSVGIDENHSPVIFEYKRSTNENVINQGLFYLNWLLDHRAEFQLLVMKQFGVQAAEAIDWRNPRLVCVAGGFTKYDTHAVQQINHSIELVRYRDFSGQLLALELVTATKGSSTETVPAPTLKNSSSSPAKTVSDYLAQAPATLQDLYAEFVAYCESLGDDVTQKATKLYFAFRRLKNFACVEVHPQTKILLVFLKIDPDTVDLALGFSRDVRNIGHFGTGDLEIRIRNRDELAKALPLIERSYEAS